MIPELECHQFLAFRVESYYMTSLNFSSEFFIYLMRWIPSSKESMEINKQLISGHRTSTQYLRIFIISILIMEAINLGARRHST